MTPLAHQLEAILRKQRPVSSEEFWAQVEAFEDSMSGRLNEVSLLEANG